MYWMDAIVKVIQRIDVYSFIDVLIFQHQSAQNLLVKLQTFLDLDEKYNSTN